MVMIVAILLVKDGFPKVGTKALLNPVVDPSVAWVMDGVSHFRCSFFEQFPCLNVHHFGALTIVR
jgi:hypothetical protein